MTTSLQCSAEAAMLIRKPIEKVYEAFVNPDITTKFWFTKSSGILEEGKDAEWIWEMYNYTANLTCIKLEENKKIIIQWNNRDEKTTVEWTFTDMANDGCFVKITDAGFKTDDPDLVKKINDSAEGFTLVLAGAKAYLEHGIELNLVKDRFPMGL